MNRTNDQNDLSFSSSQYSGDCCTSSKTAQLNNERFSLDQTCVTVNFFKALISVTV
jgi:hypothetical protein